MFLALLLSLEEYMKSCHFNGKSTYQQQFQMQICSWDYDLKADSLGFFHCVTQVLGWVFFSVMFSLYFQTSFLKSQPKKTPCLPRENLNCWAMLYIQVERRGRKERKRSRNVCFSASENYPKWQTAAKDYLREADYKPDEFSHFRRASDGRSCSTPALVQVFSLVGDK